MLLAPRIGGGGAPYYCVSTQSVRFAMGTLRYGYATLWVRQAMGTPRYGFATLCLVFASGFAYVSVGRCWLPEIVALLTQEPSRHYTAWYIGLKSFELFRKKCTNIFCLITIGVFF